VDQPRPRSLTGIFNRKKSTYGLVQPFQFEQDLAELRPKKTRSFQDDELDIKDCFAPTEMNTWELPQYQSLFHHLITQDEEGRSRLNSVSSSGSDNNSGPFKTVQRWFKEVLQSWKHYSDSGEPAVVEPNTAEEIPIEICEKLRHIHIYF